MDINRIEDELSVIEAIYGDSFQREKPKAWQAAAAPPAFTITVTPDDPPELSDNVAVKLHVKYCNTYPRAPALFSIQQPIRGLTPAHVSSLSKYLREESLRLVGSEMVLEMRGLCAEWIAKHNTVLEEMAKNGGKHAKKFSGPNISLAAEMTERAKQMEETQHFKALEEENYHRHLEEQKASLLSQRIQEEAEKRARVGNEKKRERHDTLSDHGTWSERSVEEDVVLFDEDISVLPQDESAAVKFRSVRISKRRKDHFGFIYEADPIHEGSTNLFPLIVYLVDFNSQYYAASQGKKKLVELSNEIRRLANVRHDNISSVFALKLDTTVGYPRLYILEERRPSLSLRELLFNSNGLKAEKVKDYIRQMLAGLEALHSHDLIHRGLISANVWLSTPEDSKLDACIKLHRPCYHTRLSDLYKSNPFGPRIEDDTRPPDSWLSAEILEFPYRYSQRRDIWSIGLIAVQMLAGPDAFFEHQSPLAALDSLNSPEPLRNFIGSMFEQNKKRTTSCSKLMERLSKIDLNETTIGGPKNSLNTDVETPSPTVCRGYFYNGSPEVNVFTGPLTNSVKHLSRYREDWEELEFLGKGGFGNVVKARNKLDGRIYAVKKIKLRRENSDKILREVNTLSRLSHSYIVRYYTTWLETTSLSGNTNEDSGTESSSQSTASNSPDPTVGPYEDEDNNLFGFDDMSLVGPSFSQSSSRSFPSIHFGGDSNPQSTDGGSDNSSSSNETTGPGPSPVRTRRVSSTGPPQILYIQMEFVERQTLKEAIEEGLTEAEAWRLFRQILDALVHISSLGIIHRDIKLTNIFIDARRDVKVGDFGLATSSLAAVDPSDVSEKIVNPEMTSGVGTGLYIAPEVLSSRPGARVHTKADMYSLGIVFFEMNWPPFQTDSERYHILQRLRLPSIQFPETWQDRPKQKQVIQSLLKHNPEDRPSALELSHSKLLPERIEEESIKEALRLMVDPLSPRYEALLRALFSQPIDPAKPFSYDIYADLPDYAALNSIVREHLVSLLRVHGAIETEPPLMIPVTDLYSSESSQQQPPIFLDRQGELVSLPKNIIVPLARAAARAGLRRIKRYYIGHAYEPTAGHPKAWAQAAFDIISPETSDCAAEAEVIGVTNDVIDMFPGSSGQPYDIHISDTRILEGVLARIPANSREEVIGILEQAKSSFPQKRTLLSKMSVPRSIIDEIQILLTCDDVTSLPPRIPSLIPLLEDILQTVKYSQIMGVKRRFLFRPLLMRNQPHFCGGIIFEFRGTKKADVIARGGRYDQLIARFTRPSSSQSPPMAPIKATAVQIALEKITASLASHQSVSVDLLLKERKSFGLWSPRRCDVYIVSYSKGLLEERIELAGMLWNNGICADLMYDEGLGDGWEEVCEREGILFLVWYRAKNATYKVKSVLKGTEHEIRPIDLVSWLQHQIAEQKRVDQTVGSGGSVTASAVTSIAEASGGNIQVILPGGDRDQNRKTQRHKLKISYHEKAFALESDLKTAVQSGHCPTIASDIPSSVLSAMTSGGTGWVNNDELFKELQGMAQGTAQVRDAVSKKMKEGYKWVLLVSVRDERVFILKLT